MDRKYSVVRFLFCHFFVFTPVSFRDWCVSRQLWWGHRIPAYECYLSSQSNRKIWVVARNNEEAKMKAKEELSCTNDADLVVKQDEDVLDTWFSSGLLPLSAFGWPEKVGLIVIVII